MSISEMRRALSTLYGPSWAGKVEKMQDAQVAAIYTKKLSDGAFSKPAETSKGPTMHILGGQAGRQGSFNPPVESKCEGRFDVPVEPNSICDSCGSSVRSHFTEAEWERAIRNMTQVALF